MKKTFSQHVAIRDLKHQATGSGFADLTTAEACKLAWRTIEAVRGGLVSAELDALREAAGRAAWHETVEAAAVAIEAYRLAVKAGWETRAKRGAA